MEDLRAYAETVSTSPYLFPDPDLLHDLIHHYFTEHNIYAPILHRPSFESDVAEGLHLRDNGFGAVVLLVCAIGSRYVDDPRVLLEGSSSYSAGWPLYNQVHMVRKSSLVPPRLYDVQQFAVSEVVHRFLLSHPTVYSLQRFS
jgi:hypothetical protein